MSGVTAMPNSGIVRRVAMASSLAVRPIQNGWRFPSNELKKKREPIWVRALFY